MSYQGVIFRRIGGHIIPIMKKHPTAVGIGLIAGASVVAQKARHKVAPHVMGKGRRGFGPIGNFAWDAGMTYATAVGMKKYGGAHVAHSIDSATRAVRAALGIL